MNDSKEQQPQQIIIGGHILQYRKIGCPKCGLENDIGAKSCVGCGFTFVGGSP